MAYFFTGMWYNFRVALTLYEEIKTKYPEYMEPFINTVCDILNNNFVAETLQVDEDDEIPF